LAVPAEPTGLVAELRTQGEVVRWAVAGASGLVPGSDDLVGDGRVPLMARFRNQSLDPPVGKPITSDQLRPAAERGGDFVRIEITEAACAGSVADFGRKFWDILASATPMLTAKFQAGIKLLSIEYTDRYLKSPVVGRVLIVILEELLARAKQANCLSDKTAVFVQTEEYRDQDQQRTSWSNDWAYAKVRNGVCQAALSEACRTWGITAVKFEGNRTRRDIGHARGFTLRFEDGSTWVVHPDHGLGFVKPNVYVAFGHAAPVSTQAQQIRQQRFFLEKIEPGPTLVFAQVKEQA